MSPDHERHMTRAIALARRGPPTSPNPRVGSVLVKDGRVVAEGRHEGAGSPHAEIVALGETNPRGGTLYVNLEPCVHHGRTPPCAPVVADSGLAKVVVATGDPDPRVDGRGLRFLADHGVEVTTGVLASSARRLNAAYFWRHGAGRPLVTVKLALTLDGRLAGSDRQSRWITGPGARARVHRRRGEVDAVMVGAGTVLADDPELTARHTPRTARQPIAIVVDGAGRVPPEARLFDRGAEVIVATTSNCPHDVQTAFKERGAEVLVVPSETARVDLDRLLDDLGRRGLLEIYCEGGAELATSLLRDKLVDRLELFYGSVLVGRGGPDIGDLGLPGLEEAPRWELVESDREENDAFVVLESAELFALMESPNEMGGT
ncbi:MAG: bifunctional diaminohydroxyphosphoribosylaminopyrimidine deaminase/5-amino-6-(5-phosphoribosylamino)uracil reductase RibD [Actinomycetota bacterium]|nr:bifunctional diaminohydroxyphosphoribosylaminopyrimidine deaminase/5-amino-6-(5-phosphoribosylamino)uracil reductase RibD [Actinomycetota bacterium]